MTEVKTEMAIIEIDHYSMEKEAIAAALKKAMREGKKVKLANNKILRVKQCGDCGKINPPAFSLEFNYEKNGCCCCGNPI
ncbi:MAG: hypothetical protein K9M51_01800 [Candidatus Gracilibacteria bacterium]|nr:hypothetical protein [Candidatus Gracilibacteria bacterium]